MLLVVLFVELFVVLFVELFVVLLVELFVALFDELFVVLFEELFVELLVELFVVLLVELFVPTGIWQVRSMHTSSAKQSSVVEQSAAGSPLQPVAIAAQKIIHFFIFNPALKILNRNQIE